MKHRIKLPVVKFGKTLDPLKSINNQSLATSMIKSVYSHYLEMINI